MFYGQRILPASKRVALIAHDNRKSDLLDWGVQHKPLLAPHQLIATGTTGNWLENHLSLPVQKYLSGPMGGDQQIGAGIAEGRIDALVFFWDPFEPLPHDPDVKALLRVAAVWNIPVACNRSTADMIICSPAFAQDYAARVPDYAKYQASRPKPDSGG